MHPVKLPGRQALVFAVLALTLLLATPPMVLADKNDRPRGKDRQPYGQMHRGGEDDHFEQHHGPAGMAEDWGRRMDAVMNKLNQEQREAMHKARTEMQRKLNTLQGELRNLKLDLRELMRSMPLNTEAALTKWEAIRDKTREVFKARLENLKEMQRILGEELWGELTADGMPGGMGGGKGPRR